MKNVLVVTDSKGKSLVFSTDVLRAYSLDESIKLTKQIARVHPWEDALDKLFSAHIGTNTSVGIAQVKIGTVRELIAKECYNPNPDDKKLSKANIMKTSKAYLYAYAVQPRHSIRFGAARIRQIIDHWAHEIDLSSRPEIVGTLYSWKLGTPHPDPGTNDRGTQIAREFYPLAKNILK